MPTNASSLAFLTDPTLESPCAKLVEKTNPTVEQLKAQLTCELDQLATWSGFFFHFDFGILTYGSDNRQLDTTIALMGQYIQSKVDARITFEASTTEVGIGSLENKDELLKFAQDKRRELFDPLLDPLPDRGASFYVELSAWPALISLLYGKGGAQEQVEQLLQDLLKQELDKIFGIANKIHLLDSSFLPAHGHPGFDALRGVIDQTLRKVIHTVVDEVFDRYYSDTMVRDSVKRAYFGFFQAIPSRLSDDMNIFYVKIGIDEQLIRTPLNDRIPVQSVHHLAGSGSAPMAAIGVVRTIGEANTLQLEIDAYQVEVPFNQPLLELGNHGLRLMDERDHGYGTSVTAKYEHHPSGFAVTARVAKQDGLMAYEARIKKDLKAKKKTTLFFDFAYNEANKNLEPEMLLGILPLEPVQDRGSTTSMAFLVGVSREVWKKDNRSVFYTAYATHEIGGQDILQNQYKRTHVKNAFGTSIFWTSDQGSYDFTAGGTIQVEQVQFEGQEDMGDPRLVVGLSGSIGFGGKDQSELYKAALNHVRNYLSYISKHPDQEAIYTIKINKILSEYPELAQPIQDIINKRDYKHN